MSDIIEKVGQNDISGVPTQIEEVSGESEESSDDEKNTLKYIMALPEY